MNWIDRIQNINQSINETNEFTLRVKKNTTAICTIFIINLETLLTTRNDIYILVKLFNTPAHAHKIVCVIGKLQRISHRK